MNRNKKQTDTDALRNRILQVLRAPNYRPLDKVELSKALRWPSDKRAELREVLRQMETAGEIARIRKDRYVLPQTADLVTGILQVHTGGNAHLLSETPGVKDIFISAPNLGTAMHSDKVVARLMHEGREQRGGAREGRVIKILERANSTIVGTLQSSKNFFYVIPDDPRLQHNIYVKPPGKEGQVGDKVVVRFEDWESLPRSIPRARSSKFLGPRTVAGCGHAFDHSQIPAPAGVSRGRRAGSRALRRDHRGRGNRAS